MLCHESQDEIRAQLRSIARKMRAGGRVREPAAFLCAMLKSMMDRAMRKQQVGRSADVDVLSLMHHSLPCACAVWTLLGSNLYKILGLAGGQLAASGMQSS